eukprot:symbB.v1.2.037406.t1/scaffold5513.1/size26277/5
MAMKSLLILCQLGLVASLAPGDCAFVGIYGDQDDFALVLMEDAEGEVLSLTEEYPSNDHFQVNKFVTAKKHVSDAKRGTVLKKADFERNVARKLTEEASVVMLGPTETAQYAGSTSGSKEDLLDDISNPGNWLHDASRKLSGFSIAKGNMTMTTTMMMGNMTTPMMTTTMATTMTTTMTDGPMETTVTMTVTEVEDELPPVGDSACPTGLAFGLVAMLTQFI